MVIEYEERGRVAIFTINRPQVMNALSSQVYRELREKLDGFRDNPDLWVGILTGAGDKAFSSGADLKESEGEETGEHSIDDWRSGLEMWKPTIAAINGYCLGGGLELALTCDIRVAAENARFGLPEVLWGQIPGGGGTQRLPRLITWCHAADMILTGRMVDASEAYRIGLVNKVVPLKELMPAALEWAELICRAAPIAVRAAKEAMIKGANMTLDDGISLEQSLWYRTAKTQDYIEGYRAFSERRTPNWQAK